MVEGREALGEGQRDEVDHGADGRVVVQGDERVHFEAVQQDLDHDEAGGLELRACQRAGGRGKSGYGTYGDGSALYDEADEVEVELAVGGEGDASGDHEDDERELLIRLRDAECP